MADRRQTIRWQLDRQAKLKCEGGECFVCCQLKDINFKGFKMVTSQKLEKDKFVKLELALSEDFIFQAEVWVAWHKTVEGHNIYGLYFSKIKDAHKERIYQFIQNYVPGQIKQRWWQGHLTEKGDGGMEDGKLEDRRVFERFDAKFPLRFLVPASGEEFQAESTDISAKGVGILSRENLQPAADLELWLDLPDRGEPLYARGKVAWSQPAGNQLYRLGINLEKADFMGLGRALRVVKGY
ncbi:MAG: PilZ domain-containing protein [Candidatus Omnitrophota bacterium]|nr:PilZ domain-containing protein [Candidatus Omnitrophota bacterium]